MKHAYLIIAHNEFDVLQKLLSALDDIRNDIYLHVDKKVATFPKFKTRFSKLIVLEKRINVRWGHVSQIKCEYRLFEEAFKHGGYAYYHLISGVHLPLYSQDYIHDFFDQAIRDCSQFFSPLPVREVEVNDKLRRYNFFMKRFNHKSKTLRRLIQKMWWGAILYQNRFPPLRNCSQSFIKASNWVSLTEEAVGYLLSVKKIVLKKYRFTRCADEFFVPSELINSTKEWNICFEKRLLKHEIGTANAGTFTLCDFDTLMDSKCLFARKFSGNDMSLVEKVLGNLNSRQ
jgi:hypothetical protein